MLCVRAVQGCITSQRRQKLTQRTWIQSFGMCYWNARMDQAQVSLCVLLCVAEGVISSVGVARLSNHVLTPWAFCVLQESRALCGEWQLSRLSWLPQVSVAVRTISVSAAFSACSQPQYMGLFEIPSIFTMKILKVYWP